MATNYPSGLDSLSNPAGSDALSTGHASQHANANDAIEAIEGTLGLNPQGGSATVKARLDAIEAADWVTSTRILDGTIVNGDINASAAIDPSKIAQNVVTFSNADAVVSSSTRKLAQIGTMSASRTVTLPAASAVAAGTELIVADLSGSVTSTNTIVIARAGSDTVNGATSVTIGAAYGWRRFVSDGSSKWVFDGGVLRTSDSGTITSANIADGTIVNADINASAAIDVSKLSGVVTSAGVGNLLSSNVASGTDTLADTTGFTLAGVATVLASSTAQAFQGSRSLKVSQTTGTFGINIGVVGNTSTMIPVVAGQTYTLMTQARTSVPRTVATKIYWRTAAGAAVSTASADTSCSDVAWSPCRITAVAPATAAYVIAEVSAIATGAEDMYLDALGFWQGAGGLWSLPGTPIANLGTYTDESVGRRIFTWDTVNARWQMTYGDTGWRDISSLVASVGTRTVTNIRTRRIGNSVHLMQQITDTQTNPAAQLLVTMPTGFGSASTKYFVMGSSSVNLRQLGVSSNSTVTYTGSTDANRYDAEISWVTTDAWPTTLPGTAVGTIPQ